MNSMGKYPSAGLRKMAVRIFWGILLAGLSHPAALIAAPLTPEMIAENTLKSVVLLVALNQDNEPFALGSGFVIAPGVIATNAHVVENATNLGVRLVEGEKFVPAKKIIYYNRERDLALVTAPGLRAKALKLGSSKKLKVGQTIYAVGNPMGLEGTFSAGNVSAHRTIDGLPFIQITAPISSGSSGGPVVDASGLVVGISTAVMKVGQNLNFAVPVTAIRSAAKEIRLALDSREGQGQTSEYSGNRKPEAEKPQAKVSEGSKQAKKVGTNSLASWFDKNNEKKRSQSASVIHLLGDSKRRVYYWPWCAEYEKIPAQQRVIFNSRKEAEKAGYTLGRSCTDPGARN